MLKFKKKYFPVFVLSLVLVNFNIDVFSQIKNIPVHVMGNGQMCVYGAGTDISKVYTGSYSSPTFIQMNLIGLDSTLTIKSERYSGTAIWEHNLYENTQSISKLIDFVDASLPCFTRIVDTKNTIIFKLKLENYVNVIDNTKELLVGRVGESRLLTVPPGLSFYQTYVSQRIIYSQIFVEGCAQIIKSTENKNDLEIVCKPGKSYIKIIGGNELPAVVHNTNLVLDKSTDYFLRNTQQYWQNFSKYRKQFQSVLTKDVPLKDKLLQTIDDVAILLKCQQSNEGAVIAGYPYPMGYVRDQYGTSRGMLALGMNTEAKGILSFYWNIWKRYGYIHNAQAIGLDGVFHMHENDQVESPGLLIIQAFDYLKASNDNQFIKMISPMLLWALDVQTKNIHNNMLPFNGDETYIAGGIMPRSALNDGSAEATFLFVESSKLLTNWLQKNKINCKVELKRYTDIVKIVQANYMKNFIVNGIFYTNNPDRLIGLNLPNFRHGVCEAAGPDCLMGKYHGVVWTQKTENDRYVCAACMSAQNKLPRINPVKYEIPSTVLSPFYMNSTIIPYSELLSNVKNIYNSFEDKITNKESGTQVTVGYDYGFLLSALNKLSLTESKKIFIETLFVADDCGAWSEYYINGKPAGTRCRPWESGINIEALIEYTERLKK